MSKNFANDHKLVMHHGYEAAAQTTITPTNGIDMTGFDAAAFLIVFGVIAPSSVVTVEVHQSDDDGDQDAYALVNDDCRISVADTKDETLFWVDVERHTKKWLKCLVFRETADCTVNSITAIQYRPSREPVTQGATVGGGGSTAK